jgi:hypothetical protein
MLLRCMSTICTLVLKKRRSNSVKQARNLQPTLPLPLPPPLLPLRSNLPPLLLLLLPQPPLPLLPQPPLPLLQVVVPTLELLLLVPLLRQLEMLPTSLILPFTSMGASLSLQPQSSKLSALL